jgi:hypothetical protein
MIMLEIIAAIGAILGAIFALMMLPAAMVWLVCKLFGDTSG